MKKLVILSALACFSVAAFAADGATIFKKCAICHGKKAEKKYLNKVPALDTLTDAQRIAILKEYKAGKRNKFGMGGMMKMQVSKLSDADIKAVADYIGTLKK